MIKANLVIQTAFLGDLILSVPVLRRIKALNPSEKLIVVCKKGHADFLLREQIADYAFEVEKSSRKSYREALKYIENFAVDKLFCIHRSVRSQLFAAQVKAEKKIGFSSLLGFWIFDDHVDFDLAAPEVIRQFKILETTDPLTRVQIGENDFSELNETGKPVPGFFSMAKTRPLAGNKKIAIFPGSVWATKRWTEEGFTKVTQQLLQDGFKVDLLGGPDDAPLCDRIAVMAPGAQVLAGKLSIHESLKVLPNYDLVISNDSASTHMAVYNGVRVVSIFGPTTKALGFRPWSNDATVVENPELSCRPCGKHGHMICPLGHHNCMKSISAEQVLTAVTRSLSH